MKTVEIITLPDNARNTLCVSTIRFNEQKGE